MSKAPSVESAQAGWPGEFDGSGIEGNVRIMLRGLRERCSPTALWGRRRSRIHYLAFLERTQPVALDRREMHEDLAAGLLFNKSIALDAIEPLDLAGDAQVHVRVLRVAA